VPPLARWAHGSGSVPAANNAIRSAAADADAKGEHVVLVEQSLSRADLIDDSHPNSTGYAKIAQTYFDAIAAALPSRGGTPGGLVHPVQAGETAVAGSEANDRLVGNAASNVLIGRNGNDRLDGRDGNDFLRGDGGRDTLVGGGGDDKFVFSSVSQSRPTARDVIADFHHGDRVDLSAIDANIQSSGNQKFAFVSDFTERAGQLQWDKTSSGFIVSGDVNGDGVADFAIQLNTTLNKLHASDFVL